MEELYFISADQTCAVYEDNPVAAAAVDESKIIKVGK